MTRKAAVLGLGYLSGLLAASFLALWLSCTAGGILLCFGLIMMLVIRPDKRGRLFAFSAAALCCGIGMLYYSGYDAFVYEVIAARSGTHFEGRAVIKDVKSISDNRAFCTARIAFPDGKKADIGWYSSDNTVARGDEAVISGILSSPENTSFFDSADYYRSRNIFLLLYPDSEEYFRHESSIFHRLKSFREKTVRIVRKYVPSDEGELIIGMIFGSGEWQISSKAEKLLYRSGAGHIASVSGMHMAVAAGIAAAAAASLTLSKKGKLLLITFVCALFALTADMGLSVMRAFIMTELVYSAELFRRHSDPLTSLSIAALILTAGAPFSVRSASFMLSFSGVFGAAVLAPQLTENVKKAAESRLGRKISGVGLLSAVSTAVCASAAVIPASALCLDELSVIAPFTNLLLSPLFTAAMMIAMAGAVCALLPFSWLSGGLFLGAGALCRPTLWAAEKLGSLPFAVLPSGTRIAAPVIMLVLITAGAAVLIFNNRSAVILTVSSAVFIGAVSIAAYRFVPADYTKISVLSEGNGCVIIISDGKYSSVIDLMGNSASVKAVKRYISRNDTGAVGFIAVLCSSDYAAPIYKEEYPDAVLVSESGEYGLTYTPEENIINFDGLCIFPRKDNFEIEAAGVKILCVQRKCAPPQGHYDMCIYDCISDVYAEADIYAVTEKRFKGRFPASSQVYPRGGEFAAENGVLMREEERKWLR
ncbi:MAG: ComEC family competence protein [Oscillospiraceae bacterium]|nr:ComEC family competence protein [Oscillospiraceae bacterium]